LIEDLKRQLAACEKQAKADKQTVADLRKQLEALLQQQRNDATADAKRVADLREVRVYMYSQAYDSGASFPCRRMARRTTSQGLRSSHVLYDSALRVCDVQVNDTLLAFARERAFQEDLKRPLVRVALDCWDGKAELHPEEVRERSRFDDGVSRIYPRMKAFELVCNAAKIKFPIDHIVAGKTELSKEAVTYNFGTLTSHVHHHHAGSCPSLCSSPLVSVGSLPGPDFVAKHHQTAK
jgi:hypothetical protein